VISEERAPGLRWKRLMPPHHVLGDARLADLYAELQQFAVDARRAPQRVCVRHRADQRADVARHGRPTSTATALPGPEQPEASAMPGDHSLRFDEDERRSPSGPRAGQPDPEPTVRRREPHAARPRSLQHLQLVLQRQYLELSAACERTDPRRARRSERNTDIIAKKRILVGRNTNGSNRNGLFSRDT